MQMFGVLMGSFTVTNKWTSFSTRWWALAIFAYAVFFAGLIEITIKPSLREKRGLRKIALETIVIWVVPLIVGYGLGLRAR